MRRPRRSLVFSAFALLAVVLGMTAWFRSQAAIRSTVAGNGVLSCPEVIDLGTAEAYRTVEVVIPLSNVGRGTLTITEVRTDCACVGVRLLPERSEVPEKPLIQIPPGGEVRFSVPLKISGAHGIAARHSVRIGTDESNIPARLVWLTFTPLARWFTDPTRVEFGSVVSGRSQTARIGLYTTSRDDEVAACRVVATDPAHLKAELFLDPAGAEVVSAEGVPTSRRFGQVQLELTGLQPGAAIESEVQVYVEGQPEPVLRVPVTARAASPLRLAPQVLYLPRSSSNGPVYTGIVRCIGATPESVSLTLGSLPPGVLVRVESVPGSPNTQQLTVDLDPAKVSEREYLLPICARQGAAECSLQLRVVIERQ